MADPTILSIQLTDDQSIKRSAAWPIEPTATEAELQAFVTANIALLDDVVGAQITKCTYTKPLTLPSVKGAPLEDHSVKHGGLLNFSATGTAYQYGMFLPSVRHTLISAGAIPDAGDFATWLAHFLGGATGVEPSDLASRLLTAFLGGTWRNRK